MEGSQVVCTGRGGFGAELYRLRLSRRITQLELARRARLARGYYSQIENSKRFPPPTSTLDRIAEAMELTDDQATRLRNLADAERCGMVTLSEEIPPMVAELVREITCRARWLSPELLVKLEALLEGE